MDRGVHVCMVCFMCNTYTFTHMYLFLYFLPNYLFRIREIFLGRISLIGITEIVGISN